MTANALESTLTQIDALNATALVAAVASPVADLSAQVCGVVMTTASACWPGPS